MVYDLIGSILLQRAQRPADRDHALDELEAFCLRLWDRHCDPYHRIFRTRGWEPLCGPMALVRRYVDACGRHDLGRLERLATSSASSHKRLPLARVVWDRIASLRREVQLGHADLRAKAMMHMRMASYAEAVRLFREAAGRAGDPATKAQNLYLALQAAERWPDGTEAANRVARELMQFCVKSSDFSMLSRIGSRWHELYPSARERRTSDVGVED